MKVTIIIPDLGWDSNSPLAEAGDKGMIQMIKLCNEEITAHSL